MSARGYALHSVCPQLSFFHLAPPQTLEEKQAILPSSGSRGVGGDSFTERMTRIPTVAFPAVWWLILMGDCVTPPTPIIYIAFKSAFWPRTDFEST